MIAREKLSPKARKALDRQARVMWTRNPATRMPEPSRAYSRAKEKQRLRQQAYKNSSPRTKFVWGAIFCAF